VADKFAKQPKPLATAENMVQMGDDGPYGRNV
jgi:ornithine decarboxylase/lysine decarboxylase/arginine decarboxylase